MGGLKIRACRRVSPRVHFHCHRSRLRFRLDFCRSTPSPVTARRIWSILRSSFVFCGRVILLGAQGFVPVFGSHAKAPPRSFFISRSAPWSAQLGGFLPFGLLSGSGHRAWSHKSEILVFTSAAHHFPAHCPSLAFCNASKASVFRSICCERRPEFITAFSFVFGFGRRCSVLASDPWVCCAPGWLVPVQLRQVFGFWLFAWFLLCLIFIGQILSFSIMWIVAGESRCYV
jgi:hypothetical protein